jgi:hemolysin activation/secretion protein
MNRVQAAIFTCALAALSAAPLAWSQSLPQTPAGEGERYPIMGLGVRYTSADLPVPALESLRNVMVKLARTEGGYVGWREGMAATEVPLRWLSDLPDFMFYESALQTIENAIRDELAKRGFPNVRVYPEATEIADHKDLRPKENKSLTLVAEFPKDSISDADGPRYTITNLQARYTDVVPGLPPIEPLMHATVKLGLADGGFVAWRNGFDPVEVRLSQLGQAGNRPFYRSAVDAMCQAIKGELSRRGYPGFDVNPSLWHISMSGKDVRKAGDTTMVLDIQPMPGSSFAQAPRPAPPQPVAAPAQAPAAPAAPAAPGQPVNAENKTSENATPAAPVAPAAPADQAPAQRPSLIATNIEPVAPSGSTLMRVDGARYGVMVLELSYTQPRRDLPPLQPMLNAPLTVSPTEGGYIPWRPGQPAVRFKLMQIGELPDFMLYASTVQLICQAVTEEFCKHGYAGVTVDIAGGQIDSSGNDLRERGNYTLRLAVDATKIRSTADRVIMADGPAYPVSAVRLEYAKARPGLPPVDAFMNTPVTLGYTEDGYVAYRPGLAARTLRLSELGGDARLHASAINAVAQAVVGEMNERDYVGVMVQPAPGQFDDSGKDVRPASDATLTLDIMPGIVTDVRTIASGERIAEEDKLNHPAHAAIRERSPIAAGEDANGVLKRDEIDQYVYWLNRQPGRRVDASLSPGHDPGTYALDYIVQESKPWTIYSQVSNTGTAQTSRWRERFGLVDNQLTGHDDILRLDYVTASFDTSHAFVGSYEAPVPTLDKLRWQINGSYSEYTASDVGDFGQTFKGNSWSAGGELAWNVYQWNELFVDLVGGVNYQHVKVSELLTNPGGTQDDYFRPMLGVRAERQRPIDSTFVSLFIETNMPSVADTQTHVSDFGRANVDKNFTIFRYDFTESFYIEPYIMGASGPGVYAPNVDMLVHEIALSARGQKTLEDQRLVPQYEQTAGGMYTVRGYRESAAVGDNAVILSAEYRFHVPRLFGVEEHGSSLFGQPFNWRAPNPQGRPDWNLVLKAFVDYARVTSNNPQSGEMDQELLGAGIGVELQMLRNFNIRVDWGTALKDVPGVTTTGSSQVHIMGTVLY